MSVKINGDEYHGLVGLLIAIPIIVLTFTAIAVAFLAVAAVLLSPIILIVWLAVR